MKEKLLIALVALWVLAVCYVTLPDAQGRDFYPIRVALETITHGESPYSAEVRDHLKNTWWVSSVAQVAPVVAYPLPALLPLLPFALTPESIMTPVWLSFMLVLLSFAAWKTRNDATDVLCVMLFFPVLHAAWLKTSSLIWLSLVLLALFRTEKRQTMPLGLTLALLPLKPQMGLMFLPLAIQKAWHHQRKALYWAAGFGVALPAISFALVPDWLVEWMDALKLYNAEVQTVPSLMAFAPVAILAFRVLPLSAVLAAATLAVFPMNDLYCCMLALIFWRAFAPRVALAACAFSLLALAFPIVNSSDVIYGTVLLPMLTGVVAARIEKLRPRILRAVN